MPDSPDHTYDVVIAGTGAAGFAAAMGALDEGLSVLMVESTDRWGGSSAMSGGGMWLPANPLMARDGVADSRQDALDYLEATVGDVGRATSRERKEAFVDAVADFVMTAERFGMRFSRATDYPDYYPERPGGRIGRAIEATPLDSKVIGPWWDTLRGAVALPAMTDDVWLLGRAWCTPSGALRGAKVVARTARGAVTGKRLVGIGNALLTSFCKAVVVDRGVPLWLDSPLASLVTDDAGRVTGVRVVRGGDEITVHARRGVVLATGGFDANAEWRRRYHGIDANTSGNPGNVGTGIELAQRVGAALETMDQAWWGASIAPVLGGAPGFLVGERSMPYSLMVDGAGRRFANESESYVDLGHHMLADDKDGDFWLIADARHARRYLRTFAMDPRVTKAMRAARIMVKDRTLVGLAHSIGVDATTLRDTVERFNAFARAGIDGDFGRGNSAYDRYYGDPTVHPNPNLGPIEKGPFTAYRIVIGDLGTNGGILTDGDARVLRDDGSAIEGLYASGNCTAALMGRTYPGPGSTIGPAVVFGLRAARHLGRSGR